VKKKGFNQNDIGQPLRRYKSLWTLGSYDNFDIWEINMQSPKNTDNYYHYAMTMIIPLCPVLTYFNPMF